jgi:manganese-dependent inorganic pyrophosphatase
MTIMSIYVIGHKNPDTDSIASACALAALRNQTNPINAYIPARCGNAGSQTRYIFDRVGVELPRLLKDVYPKVADIMEREVQSLRTDEPVMNVFHQIEDTGFQVLPVVDAEGRLEGVVGAPELMRTFIQEKVVKRPRYYFDARYIPEMIHGKALHEGERCLFRAAIMVGAMPVAESKGRIEQAGAEETILVVGNRKDVIEYAMAQNLPAIIITGLGEDEKPAVDFSAYKGWVFLSNLDSAETIRRVIMACPVENIMNRDFISLSPDDYVDTAQEISFESRHRMLPVLEDGRLTGIVTRSSILKKFRSKLVLVDHNEAAQAVDGVESADVLEIVDHHRLGAVKTNAPVSFYAKPVGSTCTLVYQLFVSAGIKPDKKIALIMMGGIISDTVMLKSPTVTEDDRIALHELERLSGQDATSYGLDIFSATDNLSARTPESIVTTDFKLYDEHGVAFGIGQVEVVTMGGAEEMYGPLLAELERQKGKNKLNWAMLLVTDIIMEESVLLCTSFEAAEKRISYRRIQDNLFALPGVLSRKKQLLPEILRIVEELAD